MCLFLWLKSLQCMQIYTLLYVGKYLEVKIMETETSHHSKQTQYGLVDPNHCHHRSVHTIYIMAIEVFLYVTKPDN